MPANLILHWVKHSIGFFGGGRGTDWWEVYIKEPHFLLCPAQSSPSSLYYYYLLLLLLLLLFSLPTGPVLYRHLHIPHTPPHTHSHTRALYHSPCTASHFGKHQSTLIVITTTTSAFLHPLDLLDSAFPCPFVRHIHR
jgi:hypothetical protein